jgi:subtilisin family serine protease
MKRSFILFLTVLIAIPIFASNGKFRTVEDPVPGQYIVVLDHSIPEVAVAARALAAQYAGTVDRTYSSALKGYVSRMTPGMAEALSRNPRVQYVEQDGYVSIDATQSGAIWGLDRIDQRALPLNGTYTYESTGAGVNAYIIDTGIRLSHSDFGGRAVTGFDAVTAGGTAEDCNGHGTHVAGTVGGSSWGVAKGVKLYAVRVLSCSGSGTTSGVVAGIDWVTKNHVKPAVANMSLGGGASTALDDAVRASIAAGVTQVVAAGNGNRAGIQDDACKYSPARVTEAITISATASNDAKTSWANYGNCVDWFAPGGSIKSAWYTNDTATNTISGTSMAAPHAAGVAALYLQANPGATPQQLRDALYAATTKNVVTSSSTTNNHLLYSLVGSGGGGSPNAAPVASFTYANTAGTLLVAFTDTSADSDGTIASRSWAFGDGGSSTAANPSHTYGSAGTYNVTLTVTDNGGASNSTSQNVTVTSASTGGFTLTATGYKVKGLQTTDLGWSGASGNVDVFRNGAKIASSVVGSSYTDSLNAKGGGSYQYYVCNAGTSTCSNTVTVSF